MRRLTFIQLLILGTAFGQAAKPAAAPVAPPPPPPPLTLSETSSLRLLSAYQHYLLISESSQQQLREAVQTYADASKKVIADDHLPAGTTFNVDAVASKVTVVAPPAPTPPPTTPAKAPEKK